MQLDSQASAPSAEVVLIFFHADGGFKAAAGRKMRAGLKGAATINSQVRVWESGDENEVLIGGQMRKRTSVKALLQGRER